jgi:hypothetical protein
VGPDKLILWRVDVASGVIRILDLEIFGESRDVKSEAHSGPSGSSGHKYPTRSKSRRK